MHVPNPFHDGDGRDEDDHGLVISAQAGDRSALETLVARHQGWIYNIAIRMLGHPQDAEDATQEALIKAITRLSSFEGRSRFRTWLYRLAVNHVLNARRGRLEPDALTFACYAHGLDAMADTELPDHATAGADVRLLVAEARLGCTSGMLLCLERSQRIVYILGDIFDVSDVTAAEVLDITRESFRQRLARARRDLHNFMNEKCGLVDRANPCRCAKKTRGFIAAGYVDPQNLLFARERLIQVREVVRRRADALTTLDARYADIFRRHPFHEPPDLVPALRQLVASPEFRNVTESR